MNVSKMVKGIRKKATSVIRLSAIIGVFCLLYTNIIMTSQQVELNREIQKVKNEIAQVETKNDSLKVEISQLASYENVAKIAKEDGLANQHNNIVTIRDNNTQ